MLLLAVVCLFTRLVTFHALEQKAGPVMLTQGDGPLPLILVAHRARDTVELLKALLEHEGYTVLCAYNGRSAYATAP